MVNGIDLEHLQLDRLSLLHRVARLVDVRNAELRHGDESLDVAAQVHDDALVHQPHHAPAQFGPDGVRLADAQPRIFLRLLQAEGDALVLGVDVEDQHRHLVTLLHDFGRMLDALGPRHVGDVDQPVDARLDLHERAERREVADLAAEPRADRILLRQCHPGILLGLLHAERDLLFRLVDFEHHRFDRLADRDDLGRVPDVARPAHLRDVHEAFDPRLELDERAVVRDRHDLALHARADRILRGDVLPRIRLQLLQAERDALALPVDVEDLHVELRPDMHELRGMRDAAPRHVGDVEQAVDAAEIDERAEVGDVLDDALPYLILLELLHQLLALAGPLDLEDHAARDDDVATTLVELDDLELVLLAKQLVDVRHAPQRDLRAGEERVDAHEVDDDTTLDLLDERALHRLVVLVGETNALPHAHEVRLLLRQNDGAFLVFQMLEKDLDLIAGLEVREVLEFLARNGALGFEADIEDDHVVTDFEYTALDDLALFDRGERTVVHLHHALVFLRGVLFLLPEVAAAGERAQLVVLGHLLLAFLLGQFGNRRVGVNGHAVGTLSFCRGILGSPRRVKGR